MTREEVQTTVRTTLIALARIAQRTRTPVDDVMVQILRSNEARLVEAVVAVLGSSKQPPSEDAIVQALEKVGIHA